MPELESSEENAVKDSLVNSLSITVEEASTILSRLNPYFSFPKITVPFEEPTYEARWMTLDDSVRPSRMKSRKVGNFRFILRVPELPIFALTG